MADHEEADSLKLATLEGDEEGCIASINDLEDEVEGDQDGGLEGPVEVRDGGH